MIQPSYFKMTWMTENVQTFDLMVKMCIETLEHAGDLSLALIH